MIQGMIVAPSRPIAELNPNPKVLFNVPYDSVVQGQSIWKHIFMKNLATEENIVKGLIENSKWVKALSVKKQNKEFLRPKFCLSTRNIDKKKLGASPNTVNVQEENDLFSFPNINGKTTSCPKQMKLIENQANDRYNVVLRQYLLKRDLNSALSIPQNLVLQQIAISYLSYYYIFQFESGLFFFIISSNIQYARQKL